MSDRPWEWLGEKKNVLEKNVDLLLYMCIINYKNSQNVELCFMPVGYM